MSSSTTRLYRADGPLRPPLSTASDAYVQGCDAKLTMHSGAIEASNRATVGDAAFALSHAARAHALLECGDTPAAREAMAAAAARAFRLPAHEAGHMAYFGLLVAGDTPSALHAHLDI